MTGKERISKILRHEKTDRIGLYEHFWGDTMNEAQFMSWIYEGVCGLNENNNDKNEDVQ